MTNLSPLRRTVTLERLTYGFALKTAARLGGAFQRRSPGHQTAIVLRLPAGADVSEYEAAALILVRSEEALSQYAIACPKFGSRGGLNFSAVVDDLKRRPAIIVVWPHGHGLPKEIALAADAIVDVASIRPHHLVAAAKALDGQFLDVSDARKMLEHPPADVFAAYRRCRPVEAVLKSLVNAARDAAPVATGPLLQDLVGYGEAKTWGLSLAQDIRAWRTGELGWADVDRGLLLSGPPGTGKTLFAGALARSCDAHLVATSVAKWQSAGHLDDVLKAMRKSFVEAIERKPAILFIDELDGIADRAKLVGARYETYWTQVVNYLLEMIDGYERLDGVVVVGATNFPEAIDPAVRRPGRLDRHIQIALPNMDERMHLARTYLGEHLTQSALETIAGATAGFTGAHFEEAGRRARREARRVGGVVDLEIALRGLPPARTLSGAARRAVAVHEAAHAVVGVHLAVGKLIAVVVPWEIRDQQPGGFAQFTFPDEVEPDRLFHLDRIALLLAGRAGEQEIIGCSLEGAGGVEGSDLAQATDFATAMEISYGFGEGLAFFGATTTKARRQILRTNSSVANRVERILSSQMERSRAIVRNYRSAIEKAAAVLESKGHLSGAEIADIIAACCSEGER